MKRVGLTAAVILISLLSVFLMYSQRLHETVQLWKSYNIVYVSNDFSEQEVFDICNDEGAGGIISRQNSLFSVKNRMVPTLDPYTNEGFSSESMRNFFFRDKSDSYFLMYVPEESLTAAVNALNKAKIPFGIDASAEYPALCPILCFAAFLLLILLNRVDFTKALCMLPLVAVSYAVPFYSVAAAICCVLFVFIICDLYEKRSGAMRILLRTVSLYAAMAAGLIAAAMSGVKAMLLFIAGLILSGALLFIRERFKLISEQKSHFRPVLIINARWINKKQRYNMKTLGSMLCICSCFLILSLFSGILSTGIRSQDLLLPSPSVYTEAEGFTAAAYDELEACHVKDRTPDLTDFLNEKWYAETAAYRKVNVPYTTAKAGETIKLPSFIEVDGLMVERDKTLFKFDDAYVSSAAADFSSRSGVEKLLVDQDGFYTTDYASTGKLETSSLIMPATALCVLCFLVLAVVYFVKRLKK